MSRDLRAEALQIFKAGLLAADPKKAVLDAVAWKKKGVLELGGLELKMADFNKVIVVGAGKAACPMAKALEEILGSAIATGSITTKYGHAKIPLDYVEVVQAGHPVPDTRGLAGIRQSMGLLESTRKKDLVFCIISGGGSALMPMPYEGITLHEMQKTTTALLACGATIHEINAIRKHMSGVAGGRLASLAAPATVITLILSDVIGDDLDVIASGPTVPDSSTFGDCIEIIDRYGIRLQVPRPVMQFFERGAAGDVPETPKPEEEFFEKCHSFLIGSCRQSLAAAKEKAEELGYNTMLLSAVVEGETREVAKVHAAVIKEIQDTGNPLQAPACVLSGGETTVTIKGSGKGGRNQEFALAAAIELDGLQGVMALSGGTDGTDGPTDAAGAAADGQTMTRARERGLDARKYLADNDAYHFFESLGSLLKTGPTMTNVMDLRILLVE